MVVRVSVLALLAVIPGVISLVISLFGKARFRDRAEGVPNPVERRRESVRIEVVMAVLVALLGLVATTISALVVLQGMGR